MAIVRELVTLLNFKSQGLQQAKQGMEEIRETAREVAFAVSLAAGALAVMVVRAGDQIQQDLNKLEGGLGSAQKAAEMYERIYESAKLTGIAVTSTAQAFGGYYLALGKVGKSADDTADLVTGLQASMSALGVSTNGASAVTLQLGQALSRGELNGDELVTLRENMPQLVEYLRKALNLTDKEFADAAEKKELTSAKLIGPLLEYAQEAKKQLANLTPTMARSIATLRVVWDRFIGDLDRQLGISQAISRNLDRLRDWLEGLRRYIPAVGQLAYELGGLEKMFSLLKWSVVVATVAFVAFNRALTAILLRFAAIPVAIFAVAVALEDLYTWVRGGDSLLGRKFGPFAKMLDTIKQKVEGLVPGLKELQSGPGTVAAPTVKLGGISQVVSDFKRDMELMSGFMRSVGDYARAEWGPTIVAAIRKVVTDTLGDWAELKSQVDFVKAGFGAAAQFIQDNWVPIEALFRWIVTSIISQFRNLYTDGDNLMKLLVGIPGIISAAWNALPGFMAKIWNDVQEVWNKMKAGAEAVGRALSSVLPPPLPGAPSLNGVPIPNFNPRPDPASFVPDVSGRVGRQTASLGSANIDAQVTNVVTVNATGTGGAEIAAAAQSGVNRAMGQREPRGEAFARALGVAMPRTEAAAA